MNTVARDPESEGAAAQGGRTTERSASAASVPLGTERRLAAIFEQTMVGIAQVELTGRFLLVNQRYAEIVGRTQEELLTLRMQDITHPEDLPENLRKFEQLVHEGTPFIVEKRYRRPDGSCVWVHNSVSLVRDAQGVPESIVAVTQDITEQRAAEEERERLVQQLGWERARLEAVLDQMAAGVYMAEAPSGRLLLANARAEQLLGHPLIEAPGYAAYERYGGLHPDGRSLRPEEYPLARALQQGEVVQEQELLYRRPDGQCITLSANAAPVRDARGEVIAGVVSFQDVTAHKRAEAGLRFLSEASRLLTESLEPEPVLGRLAELATQLVATYCIVDLVADDGGFRRAVVRHASPERTSLVEQTLRFTPAPDSPHGEVLRTGRGQLHTGLRPEAYPQVARSPEHLALIEQLAPCAVMLVPILARGRVLGVITLASSEPWRQYGPADLEMAEELARRTASALENARLFHETQTAVRLRDEFLSVASHELKTPLTSMRLQLELLQRNLSPDSLTRVQDKLQGAGRQIVHLATLVEGLLDASRISSGQLALTPETLDLAALVREVASRFEGQARQAGSPLVLSASRPVEGRWDRLRLEGVVTALLSNALKYGPGRPVELALEPRGDQVSLRVRDHGIGMEPEVLGRIFGRFERGVSARNYGGLGLGLFVTRRVVEGMGGTIRADSVPGQGATFTVVLPLVSRG